MQLQCRVAAIDVFESGTLCLNCKRDVGLSRFMFTSGRAFEPSFWKPTGCWAAQQAKCSPTCRRRRLVHHTCNKLSFGGQPRKAIGVFKMKSFEAHHGDFITSFVCVRCVFVSTTQLFNAVLRSSETRRVHRVALSTNTTCSLPLVDSWTLHVTES